MNTFAEASMLPVFLQLIICERCYLPMLFLRVGAVKSTKYKSILVLRYKNSHSGTDVVLALWLK